MTWMQWFDKITLGNGVVGCIERRIIGVETFYHPLNRVWHRQDGCETTVMTGEWTSANRSDKQHKRRRTLVHIVRSGALSYI